MEPSEPGHKLPQFVAILPDPLSANQIDSQNESETLEPYPAIEEQVDKIEQSLLTWSGGIQVQPDQLRVVLASLELAKFTLDQSPEDTKQLQNYRGELTRLIMVAERLRSTMRIFEQYQADAVEIVLISHMSLPSSKGRFGELLWKRCVKAVSDPSQRNDMRRKALVTSWTEFHQLYSARNGAIDFGGFQYVFPWDSRELNGWSYEKRVDYVAGVLMRLLIDGSKVDEATRRTWLGELMMATSNHRIPMVRIDDPKTQLAYVLRGETETLLANQWLAGWEQVGARFAESNINEVQP